MGPTAVASRRWVICLRGDSVGTMRLVEHAQEFHFLEAVMDENYLQRLWPLQELQLSNSVRFVACDPWDLVPTTNDPSEARTSAIRFIDHLKALAHLWFSERLFEGPSITQFVIAFLTCGSVVRDRKGIAHQELSPAEDGACDSEINSMRKTTKKQDFFLAVMPQYAWWKLPDSVDRTELEAWPFPKFFSYTHDLAQEAGFGFLGKFTRSMLEDPSTLDVQLAWEHSTDVPKPDSLGDFYKLLGSPAYTLRGLHPERHSILMSRVKVYNYTSAVDFDVTVESISQCMQFNKNDWSLAFNGELSQYGTLPTDKWTVINLDEDRSEARPDPHPIRVGPEIPQDEIYQDCIGALGSLWVSLALQFKVGPGFAGQWTQYKNKLTTVNPPFYKATMIMMAAMIGCGLGLSAFQWFAPPILPSPCSNLRQKTGVGTAFQILHRHEDGDGKK